MFSRSNRPKILTLRKNRSCEKKGKIKNFVLKMLSLKLNSCVAYSSHELYIARKVKKRKKNY